MQLRTLPRRPRLQTCPQMRARMRNNVLTPTRLRTRVCTFSETFSSSHFCYAACACHRFLLLLGERREGRGEQLAVTSVPRTSSGPMRHLKLDVCALSASSSSYRSLRQSECYQLTFTLNSCLICYFWETGRLISSRVIRTMTYPCARCGDNVGNTAEENSRVFSVI